MEKNPREQASIWLECGAAGGMGRSDLRNPKALTSVKDCRLSADAPNVIRAKSQVGITGGYVAGSRADDSYARITGRDQSTRTPGKKGSRARKNARKNASVINPGMLRTF